MASAFDDFLPYGLHQVTDNDVEAVVEVLRSQFLTQGNSVPEFEQAVAQVVGAKYSIAVNSATSALHLACLALGLTSRDWLWTSPITFVASANCGLYCGASIDFVDINPSSGLIDIELLREKLEVADKKGTLPKVLVPVHLSGSSCDMHKIRQLADQYNFFVLEDASHAIGGTYKDAPVGSCVYSDICVFSFHPVKIITTGEGGMALTNNSLLAEKISQLRSHGIIKDLDKMALQNPPLWHYEQHSLGFNYRMTDLQAALGLSQLSRLSCIVTERNRQFQYYQKLVDGLPLKLLEVPTDVYSSLHLAVVRLKGITPKLHRQVFEGLRKAGIGVQLHYSPVHLHPYYRRLGFSEGQFPQSEAYARSAFSLPLFPGLSTTDQERVVSELSNQLQLAQVELR